MSLATTYMGFELPHPLIPGASPLGSNLDMVRRLEDAGASLIVLPSLFEEQVVREELAVNRALEDSSEAYAESLTYLPRPSDFALGPHEYLNHVHQVKAAVGIPVIVSLNGTSEGGWLTYARYLEQAGADGLELNLYDVPTDPDASGAALEDRALRVVRTVREAIAIPLAVKLSPFYSAPANFARRLDEIGVDALVLFNRFYQPDIDVEQLEVRRAYLSSSAELLLRLRWLAILSGRVRASLAATGGVHTAVDVVKAMMAVAQAVQVVSALLQRGPEYLTTLRNDLAEWLAEHEYESVRQMQGSMSLRRCDNPHAYERANYVSILQSWQATWD